MKVRYTPRAFADREAIFEYLNARNPRAAREVKAH
jgi:plasmid stabilization system protein ParE